MSTHGSGTGPGRVAGTPLHVAARSCQPGVARLLAECDADVNARDDRGRAPLHVAARRGDGETVSVLLEQGADVDARDGNGSPSLHCAAEREGLGVAHLLLSCGADVAARDADGCTPLSLAIEANSDRVVDLLCEHGGREEDGIGGDAARRILTHVCSSFDEGKALSEQMWRNYGASIEEAELSLASGGVLLRIWLKRGISETAYQAMEARMDSS